MIAISAYTDPVLVATAVNDLPQPNEDIDRMSDEAEESSGFAQLLTSLLQNTEKIQTEIPPVEFSEPDVNFEAIPKDDLNDRQEKLKLFESPQQFTEPVESEISGDEIPEEHFNALASAITSVENLLNSVKIEVVDTEVVQVETDFINIDNLQEAQQLVNVFPENDFSELDLPAPPHENTEIIAEIPKEVPVETENQIPVLFSENTLKERPLPKKENIEDKEKSISSETFKKPESETKGKLDEMRSRSRRDRVTLEVRDLRTETEAHTTKAQRPFSAVEAAVKRTSGESPVREITLELRLPDNNGSAMIQGQTIWETKSGNNSSVSSAMENLLARELHQNFNGDIVRHASIALRDGGEGTIRLALKPESLGNVKIRLEMTENRITGHIIVESKEALNAFRKELASLEQAFKDSGFEGAQLNLSLASEGQNTGWERDAGSFTHQIAASRYDDSSLTVDEHETLDVLIGHKTGSINMLA